MSIKVAINGFGRIGRNVLRAYFESQHKKIKVVAINDLGSLEDNAHLLKYDSVHGRFDGEVSTQTDAIVVNGQVIKVFAERNPEDLPWGDLGVDVVLECTGFFASREKASSHLKAGAKKVLISAPAGKDVDATIVYGVNQDSLTAEDKIVSNASCTTNCLAPLVQPLHQTFGVENGLMVTIHAVTNDQKVTDALHSDLRRARASSVSMIPTKTGAAQAVGLVLPELAGKLDGYAMRVPTVNVSVVDLTFNALSPVTVDSVNQCLKEAASGPLKGVLGYCDEPLVSIDFNHSAESSNFDSTQTRVIGQLVKVVSWYDNEWGFSNRMLDTTMAMMKAK